MEEAKVVEGSFWKPKAWILSLREKCPDLSYSGPHFPAFGLNTERYLSVFSSNVGKCGPE